MHVYLCTPDTVHCSKLHIIGTVGAVSEDCSHISECPAGAECLIKHVQPVKYISVASILIRNGQFE